MAAPAQNKAFSSGVGKDQSGYGMSLKSKDARGYNILHTLALHSSLEIFEAVLTELNSPEIWAQLGEACRVKHKAAPLVLLATKLLDSEESRIKFIDLLALVKTKLGAKAF